MYLKKDWGKYYQRNLRDAREKYEEDFKNWEKLEQNFVEIIVKCEKSFNFFRKY